MTQFYIWRKRSYVSIINLRPEFNDLCLLSLCEPRDPGTGVASTYTLTETQLGPFGRASLFRDGLGSNETIKKVSNCGPSTCLVWFLDVNTHWLRLLSLTFLSLLPFRLSYYTSVKSLCKDCQFVFRLNRHVLHSSSNLR